MDFGRGSEASDVVSVDLAVAIEERECLVPEDFFVVGDEVIELRVEFFHFFFVLACDVFVGLSVSEVLFDALFDVGVS